MNLTEEQQQEACVYSNFSCLGTSPTVTYVLFYMCAAVVVAMTVCGNLLVIISICHFKQLWTPTNFLLLSLAMTDFLVGAIVMPPVFNMFIDPHMCYHRVYCIFLNVMGYHLTCVSIYSVALIAVDRCFALSNPFHYSMKMTVSLTLRIIAILWFSSIIYNMMLVFFNTNTDIAGVKTNGTCVKCISALSEIWSTVDFFIIFVVPFIIIIIMYLNIFAIAKRHAKKIRSVRKGPEVNNASMASERKAAKSLGILVAVFLLCLLPYYVCVYFNVYIKKTSLQFAVTLTLTILHLNSCINPIIYALLYSWFKRSVKLILTFRICGTESSVLNDLGQ